MRIEAQQCLAFPVPTEDGMKYMQNSERRGGSMLVSAMLHDSVWFSSVSRWLKN
jgi:hypothetical protein